MIGSRDYVKASNQDRVAVAAADGGISECVRRSYDFRQAVLAKRSQAECLSARMGFCVCLDGGEAEVLSRATGGPRQARLEVPGRPQVSVYPEVVVGRPQAKDARVLSAKSGNIPPAGYAVVCQNTAYAIASSDH
jgi:hypothetical protein